MSDLHPNVVRVVEAARRLGLEIDSRRFPDGTKTAADAAAAIGVDVGQIVKSLIFAVDGEVVLAYVSGANRLDESKLAGAAGGLTCSRVDADVVRTVTGYPDRWRAAVRTRHRAARVRRPRSAALRRGVGGRRHVARRVPPVPGRVGPCERCRRRRARPTMSVDTAAIRQRAAPVVKRFELTLDELRDRARSLRPSSFTAADVAGGRRRPRRRRRVPPLARAARRAQRVPPQVVGVVLHHGGARPPSRAAPRPAGARLRCRARADRAGAGGARGHRRRHRPAERAGGGVEHAAASTRPSSTRSAGRRCAPTIASRSWCRSSRST